MTDEICSMTKQTKEEEGEGRKEEEKGKNEENEKHKGVVFTEKDPCVFRLLFVLENILSYGLIDNVFSKSFFWDFVKELNRSFFLSLLFYFFLFLFSFSLSLLQNVHLPPPPQLPPWDKRICK